MKNWYASAIYYSLSVYALIKMWDIKNLRFFNLMTLTLKWVAHFMSHTVFKRIEFDPIARVFVLLYTAASIKLTALGIVKYERPIKYRTTWFTIRAHCRISPTSHVNFCMHMNLYLCIEVCLCIALIMKMSLFEQLILFTTNVWCALWEDVLKSSILGAL